MLYAMISQVDYSYSFNSCRFSVLNRFLLSGTLFNESVDSVSVLYDIDNSSDHEPISIQLKLNIHHCVGFQVQIYSPHVSWVKATDANLQDYQEVLSKPLKSIDIPIDALSCSDISCTN